MAAGGAPRPAIVEMDEEGIWSEMCARKPTHRQPLDMIDNPVLGKLVYPYQDTKNWLGDCRTQLPDEYRLTTNLHITEYDVMKKSSYRYLTPMFFIAVVHGPIQSQFTHWWLNEDNYSKFFWWMERAYRGPIDLFMRMHFGMDMDRPDNYQSPTTKGMASTWICNYNHGDAKWHMKADPVGQGIVHDEKGKPWEVTTHAVYLDNRQHFAQGDYTKPYEWYGANPE